MHIGLTGSIGAGKSAVAQILTQQGIPLIDADSVAKEVFNNHQKCIASIFPEALEEGVINRRALGNIVFKNADRKVALENILHPPTQSRIMDFLGQHRNTPLVVADIPLLFERQWQQYLDGVLLVTADDDVRASRVVARGLTLQEFEARNANQMPQEQKRALCTWEISNNGTPEQLEGKVLAWLQTLPV